MTSAAPPRPTIHRTRIRTNRVAALLVAFAAIAAVLELQLPASSPSTSSRPPAGDTPAVVRGEHRDEDPEVANLDPALLAAVRAASTAAAADGVTLRIDSGRRSPEHQARLLEEATAKYGSRAEAARWVATPEASLHVSGDAVDIGPTEAAAWLARNGAWHGLCQVYGNEPWHFELRPDAVEHGCPPLYPDPTHDPRMSTR